MSPRLRHGLRQCPPFDANLLCCRLLLRKQGREFAKEGKAGVLCYKGGG